MDHIVANGNATMRVGLHERYRGDPLGYCSQSDRVGVGGDIWSIINQKTEIKARYDGHYETECMLVIR